MRSYGVLLVILLFYSCSYFEKKLSSDDLLNDELKSFNWEDVDTYPTFDGCKAITTKAESKACFQNSLLEHVSGFLSEQHLVVTKEVEDTIIVSILIDQNGGLEVTDLKVKPETKAELPDIEGLLRLSLKDTPKIYPAIKRGQQVKTVFELPVIVQIN